MATDSKTISYRSLKLNDRNQVINGKDSECDLVVYRSAKGEWSQSVHRGSAGPLEAATGGVSGWRQGFWALFRSVFLPIGYPETVTADYGVFQICDTVQALSSYLRGLLTTRSTLIAIGVGRPNADATSAVAQFIFRDLAGLFGSVLFSWRYSSSFGLEVKHWRLFADVINDIALCLELLSPLFPAGCFVAILCSASICKALCGCSAGATRVAIASHFAVASNETDIVSKEGIQETMVSVLGMICGLILTQCLDRNEHQFAIVVVIFSVLTAVHIVANYIAVRSLELRSLSRRRMAIVTAHWMESKEVITPQRACRLDTVCHFDLFPFNLCGGVSVCGRNGNAVEVVPGIEIERISPQWMRWNLQCLESSKFRVAVEGRKVLIAFHLEAADSDFVGAFFILEAVRQWMLERIASGHGDGMEPDGALRIPPESERVRFGLKLKDSQWAVDHLALSLRIALHRYR